LISTLSLTIEKHFCAGVLFDVAVFSELKTCCGGDKDGVMEVTKRSCCDNETDIIEGQDELTIKTFEDLENIEQQVLMAYTLSLASLYKSLPKQIIPHKDYSPPLLVKDIQVIDEIYLI
jgi:hypothetical protein